MTALGALPAAAAIGQTPVAAESSLVGFADRHRLDRSHIVIRTDSFRITLQGNALGSLTRSLAADSTGTAALEYRSTLSFGPLGRQVTTVSIDPETLRALIVEQHGEQSGRPVEVRVAYHHDGRVTGSFEVPGSGGATLAGQVDTTLGPEVGDDNLIQAFAAALPVAADTTFELVVFDAATGRIERLAVVVTDGGEVSVPAGSFATWRLSFSGGEAPFAYYVSRTAPRRLVKIAVPDQALVFELVR